MAIHNRETLYPVNNNGNPCYPDGNEIRLWDMNREELIEFVNQCERKGVTFVATEKAAPLYSVLELDPRVRLITCLRNPLERYMSHLYFAFYGGMTDIHTPEKFVNSIYISTMFNYYCRIFSRFNDNPEPIGQKQFQNAWSVLNSFDTCVILEKENPFLELNELVSWKDTDIKANRTRLDLFTITRYLLREKASLLLRRIKHPRKKPTQKFEKLFKEKNQWDYELYQMMCNP